MNEQRGGRPADSVAFTAPKHSLWEGAPARDPILEDMILEVNSDLCSESPF